MKTPELTQEFTVDVFERIALPPKKTPKTFCVKLYCDLPSVCQGILPENHDLYLNLRTDIHDLVESIGKGVEYLGGMGSTCTWEVHPSAMMNLLKKIQEFNSPLNNTPCIIHMELY